MPDLSHLPGAAQQATDQAKELARRGAHAATALLDASFHPFRTVRSLVHTDEPIPPPPTDALQEPLTAPAEAPTAAPPAPRTAADALDQVDAADVVDAPLDLPVHPQGPAPHIPPRLAGEVERDYAEELPGFRNGDEPPGAH